MKRLTSQRAISDFLQLNTSEINSVKGMRIIYNGSSISSQIIMNQSKQQEQINRMID
jgi:hypothetical protein